MKLFSRARRLFLFAALVSTLMLSGAVLPSGKVKSTPQPRYSWDIHYYSDATYTTEIGERYVNCNGQGTLTGQSSQYQQAEIVDVCCMDPGHNGWVPC